MPSIVVLGARNLGGAILGHHLNNGWRGAAIARSPETLETVRAAGGLPLQADASDPGELREALDGALAAQIATILEVRTDRAENVQLHRRVWEAVAASVRTAA